MQTCFSMFRTRTPLCLQHIAHIFLVSQILLKVIYYEVTGWCISQENQFGDGTGGGTINYIIQLKSQSFEQIIFIVSIVCSSFEKQFLFVSLVVKSLARCLNLHWKKYFPICMQNFKKNFTPRPNHGEHLGKELLSGLNLFCPEGSTINICCI